MSKAADGLFMAGRLLKALSVPGLTAEHRAIVLAKVAPLIEEGRMECEAATHYD